MLTDLTSNTNSSVGENSFFLELNDINKATLDLNIGSSWMGTPRANEFQF